MKNLQIERLKIVDDENIKILSHLMSELVDQNIILSKDHLLDIVKSENSLVFLATDAGNIIGTFTLVFCMIPTGLKASIEDVVVDVSSRGSGVGEYMLKFAIDYARRNGVCKLDLTSNPKRTSANALYRKMGFLQRETNVYRMELI